MLLSQNHFIFFFFIQVSLKRWPVAGTPLPQDSLAGTASHVVSMYGHKRSPCAASSRKPSSWTSHRKSRMAGMGLKKFTYRASEGHSRCPCSYLTS